MAKKAKQSSVRYISYLICTNSNQLYVFWFVFLLNIIYNRKCVHLKVCILDITGEGKVTKIYIRQSELNGIRSHESLMAFLTARAGLTLLTPKGLNIEELINEGSQRIF